MKFFAVFAAIVAISAAAPTTSWTLNDLSQAIQNPSTPAALLPYLENALNQMMHAIFAGEQMDSIVIPTPAGLLPVEAISPVAVMPAEVDLAPTTAWTLNDLSEAIQNPATPADLLPYLEHALNEMMAAVFAGHPMESIVVSTPAGLLPVEALSPVVVMPVEVDLTPISPAPVPAPVVPAPVPAPVAEATSPLVQIIVNIKSQESSVTPEVVQEPSPVPSPVVVPEPVVVVEQPEAVYEPQPVPAPAPIEIGPAPAPVVVPEPIVIAPEPVVVAPEVPAPIVIAPTPIEIPNPIDVIAVGAPDFNPIDLLQPVPVNVVGPMI